MDEDQEIREFQRQYTDFLDDKGDQGLYDAKIRDLIRENQVRLIVNINDLRKKNIKRATELLHNGVPELVAFQGALRDCVLSIDATYGKEVEELHIGLEGSFGSKHVTPRSLSAAHLGSMVCVEGIITKCSMVHPKVMKSVHYCPATGKTVERKYSDLTSLSSFPTSAAYPTKDEDGNPLETEYGLSVFKDHQTFIVQEMPERAPAGQLPRSVEIITDDDLVDCCKPGDRVQVIGIYRCLPFKKGGYTSGSFRTVIIANNVVLMSKEIAPHFSSKDIGQIKRFCRRKKYGNPIDLLTKSLAPSIHGHQHVKLAILCMLLGGVEKVLENGTRLRGDINILLIGDPSTAKSQMLRYVLHTAPRAVTTTGRGSSGVGLTAAVTMDAETNERQLEAGAMVLADRGVVCIDEFDKMSDIDRTAIHEVMEQGRVTIAKAGIHAKLNARCSVLAAANPVYGRYDEYKNPMDNIGMQDSLLSRFDLIFIVLDEMDPERDKRISDHVLRMHRYRNPGEQDGEDEEIEASRTNLSEEFQFHHIRTRSAWVKTSGIIILEYLDSEAVYPSLFPRRYKEYIIAPFWDDTDTRGTGKVFYRQTTHPHLLARALNQIEAANLLVSQNITNLLIATWDAVGYYPKGTDKTNTFQCILAYNQNESFVIFVYDDIQWISDYGGVAGINFGDRRNHFTIPGSLTPSILDIEETSNVGVPGVWIFQVNIVPVPIVNISVPNNLTTGQSATLDCSAVTMKGITSRVDIVWYDSTGLLVRRVNNVTANVHNGTAIVYRDSYNISLLINKHDNKVYTCQAIINNDPLFSAVSSVRLNVTYACMPDDKTTLCFYPYGYGAGDFSLPTSLRRGEGNAHVDLRQEFLFFGRKFKRVFVNDNGVISFNKRYNQRTPVSLPLRSKRRIIAPYWADVDTSGTGKIYYRQTSDHNLLARAISEIQQRYPESQNVSITSLLIATWNDVGYYRNKTDKTNTFQCVLASGTSESYAIFLYGDLQWTTGDNSGGRNGLGETEALVGINFGDRINSVTIPGSRTPNITNIIDTSNLGVPGIWIFRIDDYLSSHF